jgi:hypothetical protein
LTIGKTGAARLRFVSLAALLAAGFVVSTVEGSAAAGGGSTSRVVGLDVSFPQCGERLPSGQAFAVVGVTGGRASTPNPCLGPHPGLARSELAWARFTSSGLGGVAKVALYTNTGDPGNVYDGVAVANWPISGRTPYGDCARTAVMLDGVPSAVGENSRACAWEYGFQRAGFAFRRAAAAAEAVNDRLARRGLSFRVPLPGSAVWWLDVETANTWLSGSLGTAMNVADIEGMLAGFRYQGVDTVGVYSAASQWEAITGGADLGPATPDWIAGSLTRHEAAGFCGTTGFSGGPVLLSQYTPDGVAEGLDYDVACAVGAPTAPPGGGTVVTTSAVAPRLTSFEFAKSLVSELRRSFLGKALLPG